MAKTWIEKLETKKDYKVVVLDYSFGGIPKGEKMLVATPQIVAKYISKIPKGTSMTRAEFRTKMAQEYKAYGSCPLSTAIFIRVVAEAMYEKYEQGTRIKDLVPFWRVVDVKGERKYSFPLDFLNDRRKEEHIVV